MKIFDIEFLAPYYFIFLVIIPIFWYIFYKNERQNPAFSSFSDLKKVFKVNSFLYYFRLILISLIFFVFVIILANPNTSNFSEKQSKNGIDIVLALDISESMNAEDLTPTRLEAAKKVLEGFLKKQKTNRVGLVIFAGKPFVGVPLTFDYGVLEEIINNISTKTINQNNLGGTAIGDAILMSKNIFSKEEKNDREKVIILLTDGEANVGINPKVAAISSKEEGIKIYTIGIGGEKEAYLMVKNGPFSRKYPIPPLNDKSLQEISKETNGKFFRATSNKVFEYIFSDLEKLEKSVIDEEIKREYKDIYDIFAYILSFLIFCLILSFLGISKEKINISSLLK